MAQQPVLYAVRLYATLLTAHDKKALGSLSPTATFSDGFPLE